MAINWKPIDKVPEEARGRATRASLATVTVEAAMNAPTKTLEIKAENEEELVRFYKSILQWRARHKDKGVHLLKAKDTLYLWIEEDKTAPKPRGAK